MFFGILWAGCPASPGRNEDQWSLPEETSGLGLCCRQSGGDPRTPILRAVPPFLDLGPIACAQAEHPVRQELCAEICCHTPGGSRFRTVWGSCEARGGWRGECSMGDYTCCHDAESYEFTLAGACKAPMEKLDLLDCDRICCQPVGDVNVMWLAARRCAQIGTWVAPKACILDGGATGK